MERRDSPDDLCCDALSVSEMGQSRALLLSSNDVWNFFRQVLFNSYFRNRFLSCRTVDRDGRVFFIAKRVVPNKQEGKER
jgi:hypothetical protein